VGGLGEPLQSDGIDLVQRNDRKLITSKEIFDIRKTRIRIKTKQQFFML
jgi:hypothetical protein